MVMVARLPALIALYETHWPRLAQIFAECLLIRSDRRVSFLEKRYAFMPPADFSRDLVAHAEGLAVRMWPMSMGSSDLDTPRRLQCRRDSLGTTAPRANRMRRLPA